jgi:hypothetical protein
VSIEFLQSALESFSLLEQKTGLIAVAKSRKRKRNGNSNLFPLLLLNHFWSTFIIFRMFFLVFRDPWSTCGFVLCFTRCLVHNGKNQVEMFEGFLEKKNWL